MSDDYWPAFGGRVRSARMAAGATQTELAKAMDLARSSIANIEAGRQVVTAESVVVLARLMRCDALWLLNGDQPLGRPQPPMRGPSAAAVREVADEMEALRRRLVALTERSGTALAVVSEDGAA